MNLGKGSEFHSKVTVTCLRLALQKMNEFPSQQSNFSLGFACLPKILLTCRTHTAIMLMFPRDFVQLDVCTIGTGQAPRIPCQSTMVTKGVLIKST